MTLSDYSCCTIVSNNILLNGSTPDRMVAEGENSESVITFLEQAVFQYRELMCIKSDQRSSFTRTATRELWFELEK